MIITYHGIEFFKVQFGETVLAFNPISKRSKHKSAHFGADIALVSLNHEDCNGVESVAFGGREPLSITGPGEYEVKGVAVRGFSGISRYGGEERINTIYTVLLEDMHLCFLGALANSALSVETKQALDGIDVLFVPIGGAGVLGASEAHKLSVSLEPKLIIPMHYGAVGEKNALAAFLKEDGSEGLKPIEKLTLKRKDLERKEGEIVVLEVS